jgi:hypothetical protein
MITITFDHNYVKKDTGTDVFVYHVKASGADLDAYKTAAGDFYREDDKTGAILWFSTRFVGDKGTLKVSSDGKKVFADMSAFKKAASLSKQFGGNFGQALAQASVQGLLGGTNTPNTDEPEPAE